MLLILLLNLAQRTTVAIARIAGKTNKLIQALEVLGVEYLRSVSRIQMNEREVPESENLNHGRVGGNELVLDVTDLEDNSLLS